MVEYCISVLLSNFHGPSYSKINNETYEDYLQFFYFNLPTKFYHMFQN